LRALLSVAAGLLLVTFSSVVTWNIAQIAEPENPVYVVGSVTILDSHRLPLYQSVAQPIAHDSGGYLPQALGDPQLLEGEIPSPGHFFVERFDSPEALQRFLKAMDESGVMALRDEVAEVHFMVAVPAYKGHVE
jgi:uncharacterized protein (DUF1330 family)